MEKLNKAELNTVRERTANRMAAATVTNPYFMLNVFYFMVTCVAP